MSDEMLEALARNGGVIQINFGSAFIEAEANKILVAIRAGRSEFAEKNGVSLNSPEVQDWMANFLEENPFPFASLEATVDHLTG